MDLIFLVILIAAGYFLFTKVSIGTLFFILGILGALMIGGFLLYAAYECEKDSKLSFVRRNFHPLSVILRICLAFVLYLFLCEYRLIPETLIFIPEFVRPFLG